MVFRRCMKGGTEIMEIDSIDIHLALAVCTCARENTWNLLGFYYN